MKNKRLLSLIALLLIAALLLASCSDSDGGKQDSEGDLPPEGGIVTPLTEAAGKWTEYISYVAPEATPIYTATKIESDENSIINVLMDFVVVVNVEEVYVTPEAEPADPGDGSNDPVAPDPILTENKIITKWFNKFTGALVKTFVDRIPVVSGGKVDESIDLTETVEYDFDYDNGTGLIEVGILNYTLKEPEPVPDGEDPVEPDLYAVSSYDEVYTYDYYYADGTEFKRGLGERLSVRYVDNYAAYEAGRYLVDSEELGKTYLMEDGKIVREFGYMLEYNVPVYDEDSINYAGMGYAYFEKNGNKYLIREDAHQAMPLGDIYLVLVPGITINVTDANDSALADYASDCYAIAGYAVLSNGNIYVCEYELLNADAQEYDIKSGEDKLNVNHKIISITDGSVTALDKSFKVSKIFNDTTGDIRSFINLTTMEVTDPEDIDSALLQNVDVDDGYMLAEIQKYADGALDPNTVFAVLNESLEIVAELPKLITNQFTYPSFLDADTMVVSTRTANNHIIYYGIDTADGNVFLLPNLSELTNIVPVTYGYVWFDVDYYGNVEGCKVYDVDWKLLRDFTADDGIDDVDYVDFRVINGSLYFHARRDTLVENEYNYDVLKLDITRSVYDSGDVYYALQNPVISAAKLDEFDDALINGASGDIFTLNGEYLIEVGDELRYKSVYDAEMRDGLGGNLHYYGDVTIYDIYTTDTGYVICTMVEWSRNEYASSPSEMPLEYTEYEYFVIK